MSDNQGYDPNQYQQQQPYQQAPQQPYQPAPPPPPYQQPYQQPYQPYPPPPPVHDPGKGMAIASMVLGIVSLILPFAGLATAVVGLILGIIAMKKQKTVGASTGMAVAGMVCSIITLAINIILIFACYVPLWCTVSSWANDVNDIFGNIPW